MTKRVFSNPVETRDSLTVGASEFRTSVHSESMGASGDLVTPIDLTGIRIVRMTSTSDITINSGGYASQAFGIVADQHLTLVNGNGAGGFSITLGVAFTPTGVVIPPGAMVELRGDPSGASSVWHVALPLEAGLGDARFHDAADFVSIASVIPVVRKIAALRAC